MTTSKEDSSDEKSSPEVSLANSREEIRSITKAILDLANARQKSSLAVSRDKVLLGQPITNPEVEKKLLVESGEYARSIGLDEGLARSLVLDLIKFSKLAQSAEIYRQKIQRFLESRKIKTVSIVGAGRMGVWFAKYFLDLSLQVFLYDEKRDRAKEVAHESGFGYFDTLNKTTETDLIIISVPITKTPDLIREISRLSEENARIPIVVEISSVKNELGVAGLLNGETSGEKIRLYSIHPLFGRSAQPFDQNPIIQSFPKDTSLLRGLFPQCIIVSLGWKEHDELMGVFLTLPHALALVFADTLLRQETLWNDGINLKGPSFLHMLELSKGVLGEDPEVYFEIQASNPNSGRALSDLMNSVLRLEKAISNRSEFLELFDQARKGVDVFYKSQSK
jgi:prephenate dehydrogenase/chorismate mutase